jgi:hypothetical protein
MKKLRNLWHIITDMLQYGRRTQMAEFVGNNYRTVLMNEVEVTAKYMTNLFEKHPVYVLGYGSLLYSDGWAGRYMKRTPLPEDLIEAELRGYERGPWGLYGATNFYGVIRNSTKNMNGVLVRIPTLRDWVGLMTTEMIVGLYRYANYRVVDVTDSLFNIRGTIEDGARVHLVCNRPTNREKMLHTWPSRGYYDRVWKGIERERGRYFAELFLKTGGFRSDQAVRAYMHEQWKKQAPKLLKENELAVSSDHSPKRHRKN